MLVLTSINSEFSCVRFIKMLVLLKFLMGKHGQKQIVTYPHRKHDLTSSVYLSARAHNIIYRYIYDRKITRRTRS